MSQYELFFKTEAFVPFLITPFLTVGYFLHIFVAKNASSFLLFQNKFEYQSSYRELCFQNHNMLLYVLISLPIFKADHQECF